MTVNDSTEDLGGFISLPSGTKFPVQPVSSSAGKVWISKICGHRVKVMINRGEDFCSENCKKDFAAFNPRLQNRIRSHAASPVYSSSAHDLFQEAQDRLRQKQKKENS